MNKKLNTFLFIIGGTIVNILLMILFILALLFTVNTLLEYFGADKDKLASLYIVCNIAAIFGGMVLAFVAYTKITKFINNKYKLDRFIEPLFGRKRR